MTSLARVLSSSSLPAVVVKSSPGSLQLPISLSSERINSKDMSGNRAKYRTCHGCHAPIDDNHQNHPSGALKCDFEHWVGCKGGISAGKGQHGSSEWRACPEGYVYEQLLDYEEDNEDADDESNGSESGDDDFDDDDKKTEEASRVDTSLQDDDILLQQLEAANAQLKKQAATKDEQIRAEKVRKIDMLRAENEILQKKANVRVAPTANVKVVKPKKEKRRSCRR